MKVRDIFDQRVRIFLELWKKNSFKTIKLPGQVIALGGGSFLNKKIRLEVLKK